MRLKPAAQVLLIVSRWTPKPISSVAGPCFLVDERLLWQAETGMAAGISKCPQRVEPRHGPTALNRAPGSIGKVTSDTSHSSTPLSTRSRP